MRINKEKKYMEETEVFHSDQKKAEELLVLFHERTVLDADAFHKLEDQQCLPYPS